MSERWQSVRLDEVKAIPIAGAGINWRPLRRTLGIEAFGINAYVATAAGEHVVEEHSEAQLRHEEVYVVLSGHATFTLDGQTLDAPAGTVVFIRDPEVRRGAVAVDAGTSVLAIGGRSGEAYRPSVWEWYFAAERFRAAGDHDSALALLGEANERFPDDAAVTYSLACWEAMAGRSEAALGHLARAVVLDPKVAGWAAKDEDLASLRGDRRFPRE